MTTPRPHTTNLHEALARNLAERGVDTLFGLLGDANLYMVDKYVRDHGGRFIAAANEMGAVLMALGYAQASGRVGVATITHGPALTNTITALVEGVKATTSIVLICGDVAVEDKDHLQKIAQRELVASSGAGFEQVRSPATALLDLAVAFRRAALERRPIVLNVPADFQWAETTYQPVSFRLHENRAIVPSSEELDNALGIIASAKRPVVLAGRGAVRARAELIRLAARIDAPLATTLKASALFAGEDFNLGVFGTLSTPVATDIIIESDCVIAFGAGLNRFTSSHGAFLRGKRLVQVNLEQSEIGKNTGPDAGIVGDPGLTAEMMIRTLDEAEIRPSGFRTESMRRKIADFEPEPTVLAPGTVQMSGTIDIRKALRALDAAIPSNRILVSDAGRIVFETWRAFRVPDPRSFVFTCNFASIGLGLSEAIGAAATDPNRPTVAVVGDGGFMLGGLAEFNTAVRHQQDLIVIVCNDASYGAEHIQFRQKNMDPALSLFAWPDFAPVASALGGEGVTVRTEADLKVATEAIARRKGPLLIDVKLDPDQIPR